MSSNIILVFDNIKGETKEDMYASDNGIDIMSFAWSSSRGATMGAGKGRSEGTAQISEISLMKTMDKASTPIHKYMCEGGNLQANIYMLKSAGDDTKFAYYHLELKDVLITTYSVSAADGGGIPTETFSLAFEQFTETYTMQNDDQTAGEAIEFAWDVGAGKNA